MDKYLDLCMDMQEENKSSVCASEFQPHKCLSSEAKGAELSLDWFGSWI